MKNLIHPDDNRPIFLPINNWKQYNNYQLCYWFAKENEKRNDYYVRLLKQYYSPKIFYTSLELLSQEINEVIRLFDWLNKPLNENELEHVKTLMNVEVNLMKKNKFPERIKNLGQLNLDRLEEEIDLLI